MDVVDDQASSCQIWLEQTESGWIVTLWNRESRSADFPTGGDDLLDGLRSAYRELEGWMAKVGHSRNKVG
jgi:hypothetical protein